MRRNILCTIALGVIILLIGACGENAWDDLSTPIQNFIMQYYPEGEVSSQSTADGKTTVQMKNGATLVFDSDGEWIEVNGNGIPLPQVFLFDQLPDQLYKYLTETEQTQRVFRVSRNWKEINVELHDTSVRYDIATGTVTYPSAPAPGEESARI